MPRVSIIIPARNEAPNLAHVLSYIPPGIHEVILVDGHSSDGTVEVARSLMPGIRVITQDGHGKGDALRAGFAASTGDIIVMMDADGSTDPMETPTFVEALVAGADVAKGSRCMECGGSADITWLRWMGNRALNAAVSWLFQTSFTDLCYGYIAFWRDCLDFFDVDCQGFEVEAQIILRARKANLRIVEVPSYEYPRIHGVSQLHTIRDGWRVLATIVTEWGHRYSTVKTPGMHRYTRRVAATLEPMATIQSEEYAYSAEKVGVR